LSAQEIVNWVATADGCVTTRRNRRQLVANSCSHRRRRRDKTVSCQIMLLYRLTDTSASRHSGTLRHRSQDTSTPKTWYETLRHECHDRGKAGTLRSRTILMRHSATGDLSETSAPILWCRSVSVLKCLVAEVSGSPYARLVPDFSPGKSGIWPGPASAKLLAVFGRCRCSCSCSTLG